jgi:hypothetical protein
VPRLKRTRPLYHVSASVNRESIMAHGLDSARMGAASGIAGSPSAEAEGAFLARDLSEAHWFASFRAARLVDIWSVDVSGLRVEVNRDGYLLCPAPIPSDRLRLVETREATNLIENDGC